MNRFYVSCIFLSLSPFLSKFFRDIFRWWNVVERRGCDPFLMVTIEGHYNTSASVLLNSSCQPHALIMMMLYYCHFAIITVKFSGRETTMKHQSCESKCPWTTHHPHSVILHKNCDTFELWRRFLKVQFQIRDDSLLAVKTSKIERRLSFYWV